MATTIQHQQARIGTAGKGVPARSPPDVFGPFRRVAPHCRSWVIWPFGRGCSGGAPLTKKRVSPFRVTTYVRIRASRARARSPSTRRRSEWPWIVQMGMGRAGFYTHEWVERPLGGYAEGHSATRIHPEFQDLKVGDLVDYGGGNLVPVHAIEPFRYLIHAEAFVLRPLQGDRTRLIVRYRGMGFISPPFAISLRTLRCCRGPPLSWLCAFQALSFSLGRSTFHRRPSITTWKGDVERDQKACRGSV